MFSLLVYFVSHAVRPPSQQKTTLRYQVAGTLKTKLKLTTLREFPGFGGYAIDTYRVTVLGWLKKEEEDEQF